MLVGHGRLFGYAETSSARELRGRRLLCSNRGRRSGCGRTFSVWLATVVPRRIVRATTISALLTSLASGLSRAAAWRRASSMTLRTGYRIAARLAITQICARIGTLLCHAPVRDGAAKGKVERFFRTVRESFLTRALDLGGIDSLNRAFSRWVEDEYNAVEHSAILMRPIDRFGLDLPRIRFLPPSQANDELFYVEEERSVLADNTFSFRRARFEAPRDLRSRKIQIRFDRRRPELVVVFHKGERMGNARPLDLVANVPVHRV